MIAMLYPETV